MSNTVDIHPEDPRDLGAQALLDASHELMRALFPAESNHFLAKDALSGPNVLFFAATLRGNTVGCAALLLKDGYAEIKSMFVDPAARGAKVGTKLLARLETEAQAKEINILRLETGDTLVAARKLYQSQGYEVCPPFGEYDADPLSVFMEKRL